MRTRTILAALVLLVVSPPVRAQERPGTIDGHPVTGKAVPGTEALDRAIVSVISRHGIPGAALAVTKDGKLLVARGYGWANLATETPVQPDTLFGVASLSKTFTAAAVLKLVQQNKLKLDDHPFKMLTHIKPLRGAKVDPRLYQITVRHLLNHSGGWDAQKSGDPVSWTTKLQFERGDRVPVSAEYLISATMGIKLDFDPGTDYRYSNFGYIVLGEVIEKASGQSYEKYVKDHVLAPAGAKSGTLHPLNAGYFKHEARRYLAGNDTELPPWRQKYSDAAGGWAISAVDMARFLTALDSSRGKALLDEKTFRQMIELPPKPLGPRENGTHVGLGWDSVILPENGFGYYKDGSWYGMRAFMKRLPSGVNWVLVFNASMQPDSVDTRTVGDAVQDVRKHIEEIERAEKDTDLFKEFPEPTTQPK
jgi:N-acyl-D-amino-acid deacylase